jgi:sortase A
VPRLGIREPIYQGTNAAQLASGVGHYAGTDIPGGPGTVGIAGHRVTHTRAFLRINLLRSGDLIVLRSGSNRFRYRVFGMRVVKPSATWVLGGRRDHRLVLTTCHPPTTAAHRLVVFAREVRKKHQ